MEAAELGPAERRPARSQAKGSSGARGKHTYGDGLGAGRGHQGHLLAKCGEPVIAARPACHLHFEVWSGAGYYEGGSPINPMPYLRAWTAIISSVGCRRHAFTA